ncbi:undecaprenyl-phosphate glucose phosphotransferase [Butyrivibrio proteoclasticus B316]|uniref:Undecaprenyl-phosphate glucose phosphotransferase n=1 Tax=Butyrivibrio proteoclasticus (strain ATCC 51982 / DSM 14932 / B316) TaxID=515622 RepID=E0S061_BUTPB|nr:sugar transferase [Butyrivibrio proteoclasticus]ADL33262.1 undecaprenyl-phosphate glucose phosphotransferase [Butyrivibrio proteoclasticus B316]
MSNKYRTLQTYVLWGIDMACIIVSYMFFSWLRFKDNNDWGDKTLHYMVCVLFLLFCTGYTFLADWNRDFIVRGYIIEFLNVVRFVAFMMLASIAVVYFLDWARILSRFVVLNFIWADILLTLIVRVIFKNFFRGYISSDMNVQRVVVVAEKELMESTVKKLIKNSKGIGYKIVRAYCVDDENTSSSEPWYIEGVHVHHGIQNLTERLITDPFDEVFINTPNIPQRKMEDIIMGFEEMGVTTHYNLELPDVGKAVTEVGDFLDYTVISYSMFRSSYKRLFIKRIIDILGGLVGLIFTGIITVFLGPAIKLDSPGPIFFSQVRIGKNGRRFKIYKFRSMYIDAEERKKELEAQNEMNGLMFKMENDPRVTKVGKFIRKTSLDEFPQFLNVLKGDMSLVGTRPPTENEFKQYNEHYRRRLSMTPGLTGLWQISGRSDIEDFDEVVKLDLRYIDNWSLTEDFKILLKTVGVVLFGKGAK